MNTIIGLATLFVTLPIFTTSNVAKLPNCINSKRGLVLVNTLDGKLTVLDYYKNGEELWSIETGPGSMLSSNIHRLELTNNGHWVRMIPSLTGSLYKFNGDTIDPVPITADSLLTSSFRYSDDLVMAGGKEIRTYGVTLNSGKLLYECSLQGCVNKTSNKNYEDMILVERNTQTVRAVEPRSGVERWNFSVGQLDVKFPQISCRSSIANNANFDIKTVVPEGLVHAFVGTDQILWTKKFATPIVNVWTWDGQSLNPVDLFRNTQYTWSLNNKNNYATPAIYIGMHNKQLYVHESNLMQKFLFTNNNQNELSEMKSVSQIPWKPFPATSSALAIVNSKPPNNMVELESISQMSTTALSVLYGSEYVNGNGYYLYSYGDIENEKHYLCDQNVTITEIENENFSNDNEEEETPVQVIIVSLWYWWKEVAIIAITSAVAVNIIINQRLLARHRVRSEVIVVNQPAHNMQMDSRSIKHSVSESSDKDFTSRYLTDFDPLHCLGKGGFGIVFEARNKIDECNYAVKRITLPNKKNSRDRVMREVRALAKLDHRNIVRYFNAWLESPPQNWIDAFDNEWSEDILSSEGLESTTQSLAKRKFETSYVIDFTESQISKLFEIDNMNRSNSSDSDSFIVFAKDSNSKNSNGTVTEDPIDTSTEKISQEQISHSCNSENELIPSTFDSGKVFLFIQMQLCRKESLRDWLRNNLTRENTDVINIFGQIVSAVEYVHMKGLIHRDLKPSNIFFSMEGEIKVGDFGLVTAMEECIEDDPEQNGTGKKHTDAVGTQLYMSPEQLRRQVYNFKVDIYSLGVILFELLVPFYTSMERNKTLCNLRKNLFPPSFCEHYKKEHELLNMMLSESPDKRPTTSGIRASLPLSRDSS